MGIIELVVAGLIALAQQAGQGIQQWINSPDGQRAIQNALQMIGPDLLREVFKRLGL